MEQSHHDNEREQGEEYGDPYNIANGFPALLVTEQKQQGFLADCRKGCHGSPSSRIAEQLCLKLRRLHLQEIPCIAAMVKADAALRMVN